MTSYMKLKTKFAKYTQEIRARTPRYMWTYPKEKLAGTSWNLSDLYERTKAANTLGWTVEITAEDSGLVVRYVQQLPVAPRDERGI